MTTTINVSTKKSITLKINLLNCCGLSIRTRITDVGRKRKYVQAGFDTKRSPSPDIELNEKQHLNDNNNDSMDNDNHDGSNTKKQKQNGPNGNDKPQMSEKKKAKLEKTAAIKKHRSNKRREARIAEREYNTICFGCRQKGHSVDKCPQNSKDENQQGTICYRCGSKKHSLKGCKKPKPTEGPLLPFASCFVCNDKGHLASQCSKNTTGVYPKGGNCKICKSVEHLAKDCQVRKPDSAPSLFVSTTAESGANADEDDFHVLSSRKQTIEDAEKKVINKKPKPVQPQKKKVVSF